MRFFSDHDSAREQKSVEWHGLDTVTLDGPVTRQVRPNVVGSNKPRTRDEGNV
jgi:hypothetical protein